MEGHRVPISRVKFHPSKTHLFIRPFTWGRFYVDSVPGEYLPVLPIERNSMKPLSSRLSCIFHRIHAWYIDIHLKETNMVNMVNEGEYMVNIP